MAPAAEVLSPSEILGLSPSEADRLLDALERAVPVHPPLARIADGTVREAVVFGDTHGDWRSTVEVVNRFSAGGEGRFLVGLGDYVDRSPEDCPGGSVANALFLLQWAARAPSRVVLLQGNHETVRRIAAYPQTLPEEVDELWGPEVDRYDRLLALLERGPIAATSANGAYFAHAGFPRALGTPDWASSFESVSEDVLAEVVWAECDASRSRRGGSIPWRAADLDAFLRATGLTVFLRGHDPDVTGRSLYGDRCLTLHTTRIYERFGGVIVARVPLGRPLVSTHDLEVEHLSTEGQSFAA